MIADTVVEILPDIKRGIPPDVSWAIDGSTSLALQGIDLNPHDIDILTDSMGAYRIQEAYRSSIIKRVFNGTRVFVKTTPRVSVKATFKFLGHNLFNLLSLKRGEDS